MTRNFRVLLYALAGFALLLGGCSSSGGDTETSPNILKADTSTDVLGYDLSDVEITLDTFSIVVDTGSRLTSTETPVTASVRTTGGSPRGSLTYLWTLPDQATLTEGSSLTDSAISFKFTAPGEYLLSVTVTDENGDTASTGASYEVSDPAEIYSIGDINGDSLVDSADTALLQDYLDKTSTLSTEQLQTADINLDERIVQEDLSLLQGAVEAGAAAPVYLSSSEARAGSSVFMIHPALLDPASVVEVNLEATVSGEYDNTCLAGMADNPGWNTVTFNRSQPGYLVFTVPLSYSCLTSQETTRVTLEVSSGRTTGSFTLSENFDIAPLPEAGEDPGAMILESMAKLRSSLEALPDGMAAYSDYIGASDEEKAFMVGALNAAVELFNEQYGQFYVAFSNLDAPTKQAWEQMARADGLDELISRLTTQTGRYRTSTGILRNAAGSRNISPNAGQAIVDLICSFNEILDISNKISDINESVAGVLEYLDWWPLNAAPVVGPVIQALARISDIVAMVTDIIGTVGDYVPELGDEINVSAAPAALSVNESATISAGIDVKIVSGLCNKTGGDAVDSIIDTIKSKISNKIASSIPGVSSLFRKTKMIREEMGTIAGHIYDAISAVAGSIVDASGLKSYMSSLVSKVCDFFGDPELPLPTDFLSASCNAIANSVWTCSESCGGYPDAATILLSGDKQICAGSKDGKTSITCQSPPPPESLSASAGNSRLDIGQSTSATATYTVSGTPSEVQARWTSKSPGVATVSGNGATVSAISVGSALLEASYTSPLTGEELTATTLVQVFDPNIEELQVNLYISSIFIGETTSVSATYTKGAKTNSVDSSVQWSSSSPGVATVSSAGVVTGISEGTATFTAAYTAPDTGTQFSRTTGTLTVRKRESLAVGLYSSTIQVGGTTTISAMYTGEDGETSDVSQSTTWTSSNSGVATVSDVGGVTGISAGTATITGVYRSPLTGVDLSGSGQLTVEAAGETVCCVCGDPGVFLTSSGCVGWPDDLECSGWHSVGGGDGCEECGTSYTKYGCTITINCPTP